MNQLTKLRFIGYYAYPRNNWLNIVDPTGLYELVNNSASDDKKCDKQFARHATEAVNDYIAHGSLPDLGDFSYEYRGYQTSA